MGHLYISSFKIFFVSYFFLLSLIGFFIDLLFTNIVIRGNHSSEAMKIVKIMDEENQDEIPIFGSSRALNHFIPSIIDEKIYNYGIKAALGSNANLFLISEELKKDKESKIIINYDINLGLKYTDVHISRLIPSYKKTSHLSNEQSFRYLIPFIRYFGHYLEYTKLYINYKFKAVSIFDNGGKFEARLTPSQLFTRLVNRRRNTAGYNKVEHEDGIAELILNQLKSTSREIIIVIGPYHKSFLDNCKICDNIEEEDYFINSVKSLPNVTFLDYKSLFLEHSNDYFFDTTHLNYFGAKKFSELIKSQL